MWQSGRIGWRVALNGITFGDWECTTALHVGALAIHFAVDVALEEMRDVGRWVDSVAVEIVLEDVLGLDQRAGARFRPIRKRALDCPGGGSRRNRRRRAPLVHQDAVRRHQILDDLGIDRPA